MSYFVGRTWRILSFIKYDKIRGIMRNISLFEIVCPIEGIFGVIIIIKIGIGHSAYTGIGIDETNNNKVHTLNLPIYLV